jgi:hypothetical protein
MVDTAMLLGANDRARVEREMWDVVALESQIAEVSLLFPFIYTSFIYNNNVIQYNPTFSKLYYKNCIFIIGF